MDDNDPCVCQRCGNYHYVDFTLPDELWQEIRGGFNLLCGLCIVRLLEARQKIDYFNLLKLERAQAAGN